MAAAASPPPPSSALTPPSRPDVTQHCSFCKGGQGQGAKGTLTNTDAHRAHGNRLAVRRQAHTRREFFYVAGVHGSDKKRGKKIAVCYLQEEAAFVDRAPQRKALFCGFGVGGCRAGDLLPGGLVLVRYKTKSVEGRYS